MIPQMILPLALTALAAQAPPPVAPAKAPQEKAAAPAKAYEPPRIAIEPKGRVNLGSVGPREKKEIRYTFTNISKAPISLRTADLSPGVTVEGTALQRPLKAGESLELVLHVDPTDWVGWQPRNVKLVTDDPRQAEYRLPVGMTVRPDLTVDGSKKSFGSVAPHESPQLVFTFTRETGDPTSLKLERELPEYLQADISTKGNKVELALTLRARKVQPGVMHGLESIVVKTNSPHEPRFELYADWKLSLPVVPEPSRVVFLPPHGAELPLRLKAADGKPFRILGAKLEGEGFTVGTCPAAAAPECVLKIQCLATKEAHALLLLTIEGQEDALKVPLAFLPPPPNK